MASVYLLALSILLTFIAPLISNSKPFYMNYKGEGYFPIFKTYHPKELGITDSLTIDWKNLSKEDSSIKKENDNDDLNLLNSKEKNIVTVDLTNDEKIVFSHLGINPLIKLGKEYITSNSFVNLKENTKEKEKTLDHKKTTTGKRVKKTSKSRELEKIAINTEENTLLIENLCQITKLFHNMYKQI